MAVETDNLQKYNTLAITGASILHKTLFKLITYNKDSKKKSYCIIN